VQRALLDPMRAVAFRRRLAAVNVGIVALYLAAALAAMCS